MKNDWGWDVRCIYTFRNLLSVPSSWAGGWRMTGDGTFGVSISFGTFYRFHLHGQVDEKLLGMGRSVYLYVSEPSISSIFMGRWMQFINYLMWNMYSSYRAWAYVSLYQNVSAIVSEVHYCLWITGRLTENTVGDRKGVRTAKHSAHSLAVTTKVSLK